MTDHIQLINLDDIADSPSQHRSQYHGIEDLAVSIRHSGLLQPIIVRPITQRDVAHGGATYECVCGHRRRRAVELLDYKQIAAIVRPMTDEQVAISQIAENLQRADVTPLDEARAMQHLFDRHGMTSARIAAELGKSVRHVSARLQLLALTGRARDAIECGDIGCEIGTLIAAYPPAVHDIALDAVLHTDEQSGERRALSLRRAREVLRSRQLVHDITKAPFDITDDSLIDSAGDCLMCPHRSQHMATPVAMELGVDACTQAVCWRAKCRADADRELSARHDRGWTVLDTPPDDPVTPLTPKLNSEIHGYARHDASILRVICAWVGNDNLLHEGITSAGMTRIRALRHPSPPPAAKPTLQARGEGSVATAKDTTDEEPGDVVTSTTGADDAMWRLRDLVASAMRHRPLDLGGLELTMVTQSVAMAAPAASVSLAIPEVPSVPVGAWAHMTAEERRARVLDIIAAMSTETATRALLMMSLDTLLHLAQSYQLHDRSMTLLEQLTARWVPRAEGEGAKASAGPAGESEPHEAPSAEAEEADASAAVPAARADEGAGHPAAAHPDLPAAIDDRFERARSAGYSAGQAGLTMGSAEYTAARLAAGVHTDSQEEDDFIAGYWSGYEARQQVPA